MVCQFNSHWALVVVLSACNPWLVSLSAILCWCNCWVCAPFSEMCRCGCSNGGQTSRRDNHTNPHCSRMGARRAPKTCVCVWGGSGHLRSSSALKNRRDEEAMASDVGMFFSGADAGPFLNHWHHVGPSSKQALSELRLKQMLFCLASFRM